MGQDGARAAARASRRVPVQFGIGSEAHKAVTWRRQFAGDRNVQSRQIASPSRQGEIGTLTSTLPIEKSDLQGLGINEDMLCIQVGMVEASVVDLGQCHTEAPSQVAATAWVALFRQHRSKFDCGRNLTQQEKGTPPRIRARRDPLWPVDSCIRQRAQDAGLA